jgi:hypothetical protein
MAGTPRQEQRERFASNRIAWGRYRPQASTPPDVPFGIRRFRYRINLSIRRTGLLGHVAETIGCFLHLA